MPCWPAIAQIKAAGVIYAHSVDKVISSSLIVLLILRKRTLAFANFCKQVTLLL